jgi:hypothetical protein
VATALAAANPLYAQKTDVVVMDRGDRLTGEIKELSKGKLRYSTHDMGTIKIEWERILHITSTHYFEIETEEGVKHYGRLSATGEPGFMLVTLSDTVTLEMKRVVYIIPIKAGFWGRLDGYIDLGFDFQKANRNRSLSSSGELSYRGEKWSSKLSGSTYYQRQEDTDGTSRNSLSLDTRRLFSGRWAVLLIGALDQNQELSLDLRSTVGVGGARDIFQTNLHTFQVIAAIAYANERFTDKEGSTNTAQLPLVADYALFKFHNPEIDITSSLSVIPILNDLGRWRIGFEARVTFELIKDFFLGLRFFDDFDSRQPDTGESTNDFGLTFSLGYSW